MYAIAWRWIFRHDVLEGHLESLPQGPDPRQRSRADDVREVSRGIDGSLLSFATATLLIEKRRDLRIEIDSTCSSNEMIEIIK